MGMVNRRWNPAPCGRRTGQVRSSRLRPPHGSAEIHPADLGDDCRRGSGGPRSL